MHANSPGDVPARLEALGLAAGLPRDAIHALICAGIDAIIHLQRESRCVSAVHVVRRSGGFATTVPALVSRDGRLVAAEGIDELTRMVRAGGAEAPA